MNEQSPDRAAALGRAAQLAGASGLTVLDRDFTAGGHRVDLIAADERGTLAVVEVTAVPSGASRAAAAQLNLSRLTPAP